jgi:hypothetical protein
MPPVASGIDIEVRGLAPDMAAAALVSGGGGGGRRVEIASGLGRVDLAPGVYDVRFGWGSGERASMSVALGDPTWIERVAVPGGGRERIVAVASPDGERSGPTVVVREESGAPAADVSVDLERDPAQDEPLLPPGATLPAWLLRSRSTDRSGSVRFCRVPPGDYFIALDGVALGRFRLSGGAETVPLTRPRLPELRLEVEDENGVPLSYASVRVRSKASGISATLEADREGRCAAALPLGPIDVEVIPVGEDAGAALEAAHTGVPLRLVAPLRAGLTLEVTPPAGTVIQDGVPARAIIEHEGGSMSAEGRVEGGRVLLRFAGVRAEEDGSFRLLVRLGDYDGVVEAPLPPGRRLALTLPSLAKGSWLEGRVACSPELWDSLREEPSGIDGGPPARLRAVPAPFWGEGIISFLMEPLYGAPVGADGRFRVWLPAGSSTIEIVGSRASGPDDPGAIATPVRERRAVSPGERTQGRLAGDVRLETP